MASISERLNSIYKIEDLETLVDEIHTSGRISVSFCSGRKFALPNGSDSISLKDLIGKADSLYWSTRTEGSFHLSAQRITRKISDLNDRAETLLTASNFLTYRMTHLKRFFVGFVFKNLEVLKVLTETSMKQLLKHSKYHGTIFSTLFMMGKMPGDDKHALVHFGKLQALKIPCFAGECNNGIQDNHVNTRGSSWSSSFWTSQSYATASFGCLSGGSRFGIERSQKLLRDNISGYYSYCQELNSKKESSLKDAEFYICVPSENDQTDWYRLELSIRRLRFLDDQGFQKGYTPDLIKWADVAIDICNNTIKRNSINPRLPEILREHHKETEMTKIEFLEKFKKSLSEPLQNDIIQNSQDRVAVLDTTPIIFGSFSVSESECLENSSEYCVSRPMKLGRDISYIMTDTDASVEKIRTYLSSQGFGQTLSVLKFPSDTALL